MLFLLAGRVTRDKLYVAQRRLGEWGINLAQPLPAADRIVADRDAAATGPAE